MSRNEVVPQPECVMSYVVREMVRAVRDTLLPAAATTGGLVALWSTPPAEWLGPILTGLFLCLLVVWFRCSNAHTRITHHRDPDRPAPGQAPTPSWTPYLLLLVLLVPAQLGLNHLAWHLGDILVVLLLAGTFTAPILE